MTLRAEATSRFETVGTAPPPDSIASRASVLFVDDDPLIRELVSRRLCEGGFSVAAFSTASDAVAAARAIAPSIALLDLHLGAGEIDGLACLGALRGAGFSGTAAVLSGDDSFDAVVRAVRAGADGYLVKRDPGALPRLLARVVEAVRRPLAEALSGLSDAALAYLETRGISAWDLSLLADYATDFEREKEVARRLGRNAPAVRKRFQAIRGGLGLASQAELVRLIRALSGFGQKTAATCTPPF